MIKSFNVCRYSLFFLFVYSWPVSATNLAFFFFLFLFSFHFYIFLLSLKACSDILI
ncbi:unnamed protein product [Meloidogyne enterolobii]|uniref:Uncharacterized protein n=1 Tax=Meloidogyne enterolobii TaxID=390850 RepID=A0ACB1AK85_MELEN